MLFGSHHQLNAFAGFNSRQSQFLGSSFGDNQGTGEFRNPCDTTPYFNQYPRKIWPQDFNSGFNRDGGGNDGWGIDLNAGTQVQALKIEEGVNCLDFGVGGNSSISTAMTNCTDKQNQNAYASTSDMSSKNCYVLADSDGNNNIASRNVLSNQDMMEQTLFFDDGNCRNDAATANFFYQSSIVNGNCENVSRIDTIPLNECRFAGRGEHLSKIQALRPDDYDLQSRCRVQPYSGIVLKKKKKKRHRPFAAARERDRLVVMNAALRSLKSSLPLRDSEQKLSKKDILQTATLYIKFLTTVLNSCANDETCVNLDFEEQSNKTVDLNEHNYLYR
eukprot:gene11211-12388_t